MRRIDPLTVCLLFAVLLTGLAGSLCRAANPSDGSQFGGSSARNNAPEAEGLPAEWDIGGFEFRTDAWQSEKAVNIKWVAKLGSESYGSPVIAGGRVFCPTNNRAAYIDRYPDSVDLGCLLAFDLAEGRFLWQHSVEKLPDARTLDWPNLGICCSPLVEGDRLWIVTNRAEVVCLDTEGFFDGQNDGPFRDEPATDDKQSDIVWSFNMMRELGIVQHAMACCSVTSVGNLLFVGTSNGLDDRDKMIPAPEAPSFIALDKRSGKLIWTDASPGGNILHGQWASPAVVTIDGVSQVLFPGGDGWLYSFLAEATSDGRAQLLWKFDLNPKQTVWEMAGYGDRNNIIATPVVYQGLVYLATGREPEEAGQGQGDLWCIDPTKRGDVSSHLVLDQQGRAVAPRRTYALDEAKGERIVPNPNSAAVWHYQGEDTNGDGRFSFTETMDRTIGMVAIRDNLLVIGTNFGLIHCLDPKSGKVHWTHDTLARIWGSPLIADGKIYVGDEDGDVSVFEASTEKKLLAENNLGNSIYSAPVTVGGVLYISTRSHLIAIEAEE